MLLEFKVGNSRSFKDIVTFSMIAAPISEHEESHVFSFGKFQLVKSAVLYGANASGKSNLLKAMNFMNVFISNSAKDLKITERPRFRLSTETDDEPSFFEMTFICNKKRYRYGFEVNEHEVCAEWLFFVPSRQEARLFTREKEHISIGQYFKEGKGLAQKTRPNALFLSVVAQFNGEIATQILQWFASFRVLLDFTHADMNFTLRNLANPDFKKGILQFLKMADIGIHDIAIEEHSALANFPEIPSGFPQELKVIAQQLLESLQQVAEDSTYKTVSASTFHPKYDAEHQSVSVEQFNLERHESLGTQKFLSLLGPLFDSLNFGSVLVIDELDTRLHPFLTQLIVQLFHTPHLNPRNVQLIFATHDTNLLSKDLFRRDQIWFTEKDAYGATDLYSLVEYKPTGKQVRKDASFKKNYMLGRYGAIPFIGGIDNLLTS